MLYTTGMPEILKTYFEISFLFPAMFLSSNNVKSRNLKKIKSGTLFPTYNKYAANTLKMIEQSWKHCGKAEIAHYDCHNIFISHLHAADAYKNASVCAKGFISNITKSNSQEPDVLNTIQIEHHSYVESCFSKIKVHL